MHAELLIIEALRREGCKSQIKKSKLLAGRYRCESTIITASNSALTYCRYVAPISAASSTIGRSLKALVTLRFYIRFHLVR